MLKLYGAVQNYAWGKIGNHSIIANFQEYILIFYYLYQVSYVSFVGHHQQNAL